MAYNKTIWVNGETPVNAENMNNIENGIVSNGEQINDLKDYLDFNASYMRNGWRIREDFWCYLSRSGNNVTIALNLVATPSENGVTVAEIPVGWRPSQVTGGVCCRGGESFYCEILQNGKVNFWDMAINFSEGEFVRVNITYCI